jgi:D-glycero-D-manno-heptose 1,7-bisphosphate phosphatase
MKKSSILFLDRDGVLIKNDIKFPYPKAISDISDLELFPNLRQILQEIKNFGYKLAMITNQPDAQINSHNFNLMLTINNFLSDHLDLDDVQFCTDRTDKLNYKPNPGMLLKSLNKLDGDIQHSFFVGDRWKDIVAGEQIGLKTILFNGVSEGVVCKPNFTATNWGQILNMIRNDLNFRQREY